MDPRVKAWFEARDNIEASNRLSVEEPLYWACLLCAVGNAVLAATPDSVMEDVEAELARRAAIGRRIQKRTQRKIKDDLHGK